MVFRHGEVLNLFVLAFIADSMGQKDLLIQGLVLPLTTLQTYNTPQISLSITFKLSTKLAFYSLFCLTLRPTTSLICLFYNRTNEVLTYGTGPHSLYRSGSTSRRNVTSPIRRVSEMCHVHLVSHVKEQWRPLSESNQNVLAVPHYRLVPSKVKLIPDYCFFFPPQVSAGSQSGQA